MPQRRALARLRIGALAAAAAAVMLAAPAALASSPGDLRRTDARPGDDGSGAQLASNRSGSAIAVWLVRRAGSTELVASRRSAGQRWSPPRRVLRATGLQLVTVALDDQGGADVAITRPSGRNLRLELLRQPRGGTWESSGPARLISEPGLEDLSTPKAAWAFAPDGSATVGWCVGGPVIDGRDGGPGTIWAASRDASGRWQPPQPLWISRSCGQPRLAVGPEGRAVATWPSGDSDDVFMAVREGGGVWGPAEPAPAGLLEWPPPLLFAPGTHRWLSLSLGGDPETEPGSNNDTFPSERVPLERDTAAGWLGAGLLGPSSLQVAGDGTPVLITASEAEPVPGGGYGTSVLWSTTRGSDGRWKTTRLDRFAAASDPYSDSDAQAVDLDRRGDGRVVATWMQAAHSQPCRAQTFRSTRAVDGRWSARMMLAEHPAWAWDRSGRCVTRGPVQAEPPPASLLWRTFRRQLSVRDVPVRAKGATRPSVELLTTTWDSIRRAGAIEFSCRATAPGFCHVSLLPAARNRARREALELYCRPLFGSARLRRAGDQQTVRLPLTPGCYAGGPRPMRARPSLSVPVFAVADAVGHSSGSRSLTVRVRR